MFFLLHIKHLLASIKHFLASVHCPFYFDRPKWNTFCLVRCRIKRCDTKRCPNKTNTYMQNILEIYQRTNGNEKSYQHETMRFLFSFFLLRLILPKEKGSHVLATVNRQKDFIHSNKMINKSSTTKVLYYSLLPNLYTSKHIIHIYSKNICTIYIFTASSY